MARIAWTSVAGSSLTKCTPSLQSMPTSKVTGPSDSLPPGVLLLLSDRSCPFLSHSFHHFACVTVSVGESEERLQFARDQLEQYVMVRIGTHAFKLTATGVEDVQLLKRMQILSFLTPNVS